MKDNAPDPLPPPLADGGGLDESCAATMVAAGAGVTSAQAPPKVSLRPSPSRPLSLLEENDGWIDGKFRLLEKVGEGGFGLVFKAEQTQPIHRLVALKILKAGADTEQVIARFETERQSLALMEHPNIARVLDAGQTERGQPYFVMELVRGRSITRYCSKYELSLAQRIELFIPVCSAVHHAHQKGIIHRDLKPSNVLVMEEGGVPSPKVIDFGIAKVLERKVTAHTLDTGMDQLVGTPGYISPEQIEFGSSHVDTRSDVYALGSILMEILTGKPLVTPMDIAQKPLHQILRDQAERDPPRASSREPRLKGDLDWIILKALSREPARRYGSAEDLANDLRRFLRHQPVTASPPTRAYLIGKFVRRHRVAVAAGVAVALAVLTGGITSTALYFRAEQSRREATLSREDLRRSFSRSDEQMARQLTERTEYPDAVAWLCRALRTDAANQLAAINLLTLLEHVHLPHAATPPLPLPAGAAEARLVGFSREAGCAVAISAPAAPAGGGAEVLSVWDTRSSARQDYALPAGVVTTCLAVSKEGRHAVTAYDNGTVELWSLPDGQRRTLTPALQASVLCLAQSGDGQTLAVAAEDGTVQVWSLAQADRPALVLKQNRAGLVRPALTLDYFGTLVAASAPAGDGSTELATVWDLHTGEPVAPPIEADHIAALALHREREVIAVGTHDGAVHVGNYRTRELLLPALVHPGAVTTMAINSDATTLTAGDSRGYLYGWDLATGQPREPAQAHDGEILATVQAAEQGLIASVSRHGEFEVWNQQTGMRVHHRLQHSVADVSVTPDCSMLAVAPRHEGHVRVWSIHDRMATRRFLAGPEEALVPEPQLPVRTPDGLREAPVLAWNASLGHAAAAGQQGEVIVFDYRTGRPVAPPLLHPPAVGAVALSRDGRLAVTSGRDQEVRVWDLRTGKSSGISLRHRAFVSALALSPDAERLVTVTDEGEIRVFETATGNGLTPGIREGGTVTQVTVTDDGARLLYRAEGEGWFSMPMPPRAVFAPEWFLDLAEGLARRKLSPDGKVEPLSLQDFRERVRQIPVVVTETERAAARWAAWLLADPQTRPLSPLEDESFAEYVSTLRRTETPHAAAEASRYQVHAEAKRQGAQ
jgi:WD40 repeat protein